MVEYKRFNIENKDFPTILSLEYQEGYKTDIWSKEKHSFDKLSYQYYGSPFFYKLIMMANLNLGIDEADINDGAILIIPYPLDTAIATYQQKLNNLSKIRFI
jgi:hypothetical protein